MPEYFGAKSRVAAGAQCETEAIRPVRPYRQRVSRPDLKGRPVEMWMIRWINALDAFGGRAYLRDLRRAVNDYKDLAHSRSALARLQVHGYVQFEPEGRRTVVTLRRLDNLVSQTTVGPKKRRHAPRSRGQTEWLKQLLEEAQSGEEGLYL